MSQYFPKLFRNFGGNIKIKVDLSNYATKTDIYHIHLYQLILCIHIHIYLHSIIVYCYKHLLHLQVPCHSIYLVSLILDIRLKTLTFKFLTTSGTHNFE